MKRTEHLKVGLGYIKEGPKCVHLAYVCDTDRWGSMRGLYFRANKLDPIDQENQLHFTTIPGNVNWTESTCVTMDQIKATMQQYCPTLHFWVAQYYMGLTGVASLQAFYET